MKKLATVLIFGIFAGTVLLQSIPVSALGPSVLDPTDVSGFAQPVYLSSADSGSVVTGDIGGTSQRVGIYFTTKPAANYTITIQQGDLCKYHSDRNPTAPDSTIIDYAWSRGDDPVDGRVVTKYSFADYTTGAIIKTVNGVVQSSGSGCDVALVVAPSWLKYDNNLGKWGGYVQVDGQTRVSIGQAAGSSGYVNSFRIVAPAGATMSFEGGKYFAIDAGGKMVDYGNLVFPFAVDCTGLPAGKVIPRTLILKDPDNGTANVQPSLFWFTIHNDTTGADLKYASGSGAANVVSAVNSNITAPAAGATKFYPKSVNGGTAAAAINMVTGQRYRWIMWNVYDNNTIQFQLPYDSIYYQNSCKHADITTSAKVTNTANAPIATANAGDTIKFTNQATTANLNGVLAADSFNWSITGTNAVGSTSALISPAGGKIPVGSSDSTYIIPPGTPNGTIICRTTNVSLGNVPYPSLGPSASACVTVNGPPAVPGNYDVFTSAPSHEKGSGSKDVTFSLSVSASACVGNATIVWYGSDGTTNTPDITSTVPCGTAQTYSDPAALITVPAATLDAVVGNSYGTFRGYIKTVNGAASPKVGSPQSIIVYTVPFARFFGQDVRVCNTVANSRFLWDDRGGANPAQKGSFTGLAAIFTDAVSNYDGLHTNTSASRDTLDAIWNPQPSCGPPTIGMPTAVTAGAINLNAGNTKRYYTPAGASIGGGLSGQVTINSSGDVIITSDITSSLSGGAFDPTTSPVLLVQAPNIYIANNVKRVDAVLLATGDVYTCATVAGAPIPSASLELAPGSGGCQLGLEINGAVSAGGRIHFSRASGTRYLSNSLLTPPAIGSLSTSDTDPAEVINFPTYLNFMTFNTKVKSSSGYDTYTILPPRL